MLARIMHQDISNVQREQATGGQSKQQAKSLCGDLFNMHGIYRGCDNASEIWNYVDYDGVMRLKVDQWFPNMLTFGNSPN